MVHKRMPYLSPSVALLYRLAQLFALAIVAGYLTSHLAQGIGFESALVWMLPIGLFIIYISDSCLRLWGERTDKMLISSTEWSRSIDKLMRTWPTVLVKNALIGSIIVQILNGTTILSFNYRACIVLFSYALCTSLIDMHFDVGAPSDTGSSSG